MVQAAWLKIFNSLLNDAVFEKDNSKKSITISTLSKYCACFIQYKAKFTKDKDIGKYLQDIWSHYYNTRRIYLNSTKADQKDLQWLEKLYFISSK